MFDLSSDDLTVLRAGDPLVKKYYSVCPRNEVFSGTIGSFLIDADTHGIYGLVINDPVGDLSDIELDMTIDVGSVAGANDLGSFRVQKTPTAGLTPTLWVNETLPGENQVALNAHITVRDEYRIWQRRPRLVGTKTGGSTFINSFISYRDYDRNYTDQNKKIEPKANIIQEKVDDDHLIAAKPAGMLDKGEIYRTVKLDASASKVMAYGGGTAPSPQWFIKDGTIIDGDEFSNQITVTFPEGFRHIKLQVTDDLGGVGLIHFPIWAHGPNYKPFTAFNITKDERLSGREMSFEFYGDDDLTPGLIMNTMGCYWEQIIYPSEIRQYVDQYVGWIVSDNANLRGGHTDKYSIDMGGVQRFLSSMDGFGLTVVKTTGDPTLWWQCRHIITMRVIYNYIFRWYTTAMNICNFFPANYPDEMGGEEIKKSQVWDQVTELMKTKKGGIGCDSLNGIWCWNHPSYVFEEDRTGTVVMALEKTDWKDEDGLTVTSDGPDKIGMSKGSGSTWDGITSSIFYAIAPAKGGGSAAGSDDLPFQRLTNAGGLTELRRLVMYHYYRMNAKRGSVSITLIRPMDVFEPGRGDQITLTYDEPNLSGKSIVTRPFLVTGVSVNHSSEDGQPPKVIALTLEEITNAPAGFTGDEDEQVTDNNSPASPVDDGYTQLPILPIEIFPDSNNYPPPTQPPSPLDDTVSPIVDSGLNGNTVMILTRNNEIHVTETFKSTALGTIITPTFDTDELPQSIKFGKRNISTGEIDAMVLSSKSTTAQSRVWHCPDVAAVSIAWENGAWINGMYSLIEKTDDSGKIHIYDPGDSQIWSKTWDFTANSQGFSIIDQRPFGPSGHYISGTGWVGNHMESLGDGVGLYISSPTIESKRIINIRAELTFGGKWYDSFSRVGPPSNSYDVANDDGDYSYNSGPTAIDVTSIEFRAMEFGTLSSPPFPVLRSLTVVGLGVCPFPSPDPDPHYSMSFNAAYNGFSGWRRGTSTGLYLSRGSSITFEVLDGTVEYDTTSGPFTADGDLSAASAMPGGPIAGSHKGALVYRFSAAIWNDIMGDYTEWQFAGVGPTTVTAKREGFLFFYLDDDYITDDNTGVLTIKLSATPRTPKDAYSSNYGLNYLTAHVIGTGKQSNGGYAVRGNTAIAYDHKQAMHSITDAAYSNIGHSISESGMPSTILIPRKKIGSSLNNSLSNPEYLGIIRGIGWSSGNPPVFKASPNIGGTVITITDKTPKIVISTVTYYYSPLDNARPFVICESNGRKMAGIGYINGYSATPYLWTTSDGGTTWNVYALAEAQGCIAMRASDVSGNELYFSGAYHGFSYYSLDFGVTINGAALSSQVDTTPNSYVKLIEVLP